VFANPIEPRASIADYDDANDRYVWITPSQGVRYMLRVLCDQVFNVPDDQVHVVCRARFAPPGEMECHSNREPAL
jgi:CO/xanthine dehydrogenase Mo-binding subunit